MATPLAASACSTLFAYPFRPFFLLVGVFGCLLVLAWLGQLMGWLTIGIDGAPVAWHAHEMLFGLGTAAVAGFLLTAMTNWTGTAPLRGVGLIALVTLWLLGRLAMTLAGWLPPWLVSVTDLAFLPVMAVYVGGVLAGHANRHRYILPPVLILLALANGAMHAGFLGLWPPGIRLGEVVGLDLFAVLMLLIGSRIIPAFTANWLRGQGSDPGTVTTHRWVEGAALGALVAMLAADLAGWFRWGAALALAAAVVNGVRWVGWRGWRVLREPLLWILHVGYLWVVLALLLKGLAGLGADMAATAWYHALGAGAMGTMILGVMTRVALAHTGRLLRLPPGGVIIYSLVLAGGVGRTMVALGWLPGTDAWLLAVGLLWAAAFGLFAGLYGPILSQPRVDGRSG